MHSSLLTVRRNDRLGHTGDSCDQALRRSGQRFGRRIRCFNAANANAKEGWSALYILPNELPRSQLLELTVERYGIVIVQEPQRRAHSECVEFGKDERMPLSAGHIAHVDLFGAVCCCL